MSAEAQTRFESLVEVIVSKHDVSVEQVVTDNISPREPDQYAVLAVDPGTVDAVPADLLVEVSDRGLSVVEVRRTDDIGLAIKIAPQADRSD
jgi:hypothetical protein